MRKYKKRSKGKTIPKKRKRQTKIDIDQILLQKRQIFIFGEIDDKMAFHVTRQLIALAQINTNPIAIYIDSPGGDVANGFSIINCMRGIAPLIVTMIIGKACSMAGVIAIAGDRRLIAPNTVWMAHDMRSGIIDYATKIEDRAEFIKNYQKKIFNFIREHTKLSEKEIRQAINGELWLFPEECLKKGVVDNILKGQDEKK